MNQESGALSGLSAEQLRAAVRSVLREVLPAGVAEAAGPGAGHGDVTMASDADLTAFVRRIATLCEDPELRAALREGRHAFRLGPGGPEAPGLAAPPPIVTRIDRGAVTERAVLKAAREGARLLLGRGAVLTPLARDKARSLGVEIEKER
jgi:hypothetical protein